ncbi:GNAT family N-acetyltransferase [Aquimarina longa]|uniref:GNAT family N-acetyltransferase n=1 Tax=Aquimarina longa TaxID=1080221 RepID=UPI0007828A8C|nr:GNAT family N-acetyltransferase [Aquimarina longa]
MIEIRPYLKSDRIELIKLLRLNTPNYFSPDEESDFISYLDSEIEDYFVVQEDSKIIGSGGINYFPKEKIARISWDIIHPNKQGKGIGKKLTLHRIQYIKKNSVIELINVRTSQLAYKFYEKIGFKLIRIKKDYWAKDFDLYLMSLDVKD